MVTKASKRRRSAATNGAQAPQVQATRARQEHLPSSAAAANTSQPHATQPNGACTHLVCSVLNAGHAGQAILTLSLLGQVIGTSDRALIRRRRKHWRRRCRLRYSPRPAGPLPHVVPHPLPPSTPPQLRQRCSWTVQSPPRQPNARQCGRLTASAVHRLHPQVIAGAPRTTTHHPPVLLPPPLTPPPPPRPPAAAALTAALGAATAAAAVLTSESTA